MSEEIKVITHELLKSWAPCVDGFEMFCKLFPDGADLEMAINGLLKQGHPEWGYWLFNRCKENELFKKTVLKGYLNTGCRNTGDLNTGNRNTGNRNTGDSNTGDSNTGYHNTGDSNTGNGNTGDSNTGYHNTGNCNSGNWNSGDRNSGFFNTITPEEIFIFNKPCQRSTWENADIPSFLYFNLIYWVDESEMTDEEKKSDPNFYIRGGQLKKRDYKEAFRSAWDNADPKDRIKVKDLPNFDAAVFFEISGIDLRK